MAKRKTEREFGSASTLHHYFQEWTEKGVFFRLWKEALGEYDTLKGIDWGRSSTASVPHQLEIRGLTKHIHDRETGWAMGLLSAIHGFQDCCGAVALPTAVAIAAVPRSVSATRRGGDGVVFRLRSNQEAGGGGPRRRPECPRYHGRSPA